MKIIRLLPVIFLALVFLIFLGNVGLRLTQDNHENHYLLQSEAFLNHRLDISKKLLENSEFEGKQYVAFPPSPSILLLPFVYLFGVADTNVILISAILTLISAWCLFSIFRQFDIGITESLWLLAAFFLGTGYWKILTGSNYVWQFAQIVAVTGLILALYEGFGRARPWLVGLYLGFAILARTPLFFAIPFFMYLLWEKNGKKYRLWEFFGVLFLYLGGMLYFNWLRFHDPLEFGYHHMEMISPFKDRLALYGFLNYHYIPYNLTYLFFQGFHVEFLPPDYTQIKCLDPFGTSLTFASPFVFLAFWAIWKRSFKVAIWLSIGMIICFHMFYLSNGIYQINAQRYTLDYMPFLILLVGLALKKVDSWIWKSLIIYSIALNLLARFYCSVF